MLTSPARHLHLRPLIWGALGRDCDEAFADDPAAPWLVFGLIRPPLEKRATIARDGHRGAGAPGIIGPVGGPRSLPRAAVVFHDVLGHDVVRSVEPLLPTSPDTAMRRNP